MLENIQLIQEDLLHSASVVDAKGQEVPITQEMINQACEKIEKNLEQRQTPSN